MLKLPFKQVLLTACTFASWFSPVDPASTHTRTSQSGRTSTVTSLFGQGDNYSQFFFISIIFSSWEGVRGANHSPKQVSSLGSLPLALFPTLWGSSRGVVAVFQGHGPPKVRFCAPWGHFVKPSGLCGRE